MYAATCPSEPLAGLDAIRVTGAVGARFAIGHRGTRIADLLEAGGFRFRFPDQERDECEAVLVNTGGGMTGGDAMALTVEAGPGAGVLVTTQSAEKVYRSSGAQTAIGTNLTLAKGSRLAFLPQETILFSGARLRRSLEVEMAADATLIAAEAIVFGRIAMGEEIEAGSLRDRWRIRRGGMLVFAEDVRLDGAMQETLQRKAVGAGARAVATVLYAAADAEARLDAVRALLDTAGSEAGAACFDRLMVIRLLAKDPGVLRRDLAACLAMLRGAPLPRVWQC